MEEEEEESFDIGNPVMCGAWAECAHAVNIGGCPPVASDTLGPPPVDVILPRQVSWLTAQRLDPAFPELSLQWH